MPQLFRAATQVLDQHAGHTAVDELVQIGRVPPDGARGHPKVGAALLDPCEDAPANRIHVQIVFVNITPGCQDPAHDTPVMPGLIVHGRWA